MAAKPPAGGAELRLIARDAEDVAVVSSLLQDALLPLRDARYEPGDKTFVAVFNRFCWELAPQDQELKELAAAEPIRGDARYEDADPGRLLYRRNVALRATGVRGVKTQGLDIADRDQILNLLAIGLDAPDVLTLRFSQGASLRLEIEGLDLRLRDIGEPWPTLWRPRHGLDAGPGDG